MQNLFSDEVRRQPFDIYRQMRKSSPVFHVPPPFDGWMIFDYAAVKWALNDHETFSSRVPAPPNWFIFTDPPNHTKLRALISQAFTPRMVANLEPRIREISGELLDRVMARDEMDLVADYSTPLPMRVISEMIGMPPEDLPLFQRWSNTILKLSYTRAGGEDAASALQAFMAAAAEMRDYLEEVQPKDNLLAQLRAAEVDGARLTREEILGFFQLLVVAGQETTTGLLNNAVLCLMENPGELEKLRRDMDQLPSAIEEVLRYRSPLQWMMRTPRRDVEVHGTLIPAGKLVLPMIGSANHDEAQFTEPDRFDIRRDPNAHVAFGHGIHFCLGAPLSRLEARIGLTDILQRFRHFEPAGGEAWKPRPALHVYGPASLPVRFELQQAPPRAAVP
ncbi:MAG TPA: cytochrome P450 [Candidatus Sulfopaludibacter sp.]|jgi:cytochrome P450|nr:cytochrome P450 [Candidatus Sulfopaludibacter sp.]